MMDLFLLAEMGGRTVAIDADQVHSVVDIGEIIPVPRANPCVRGLVALRSRVVTVICTRIAMGMPVPKTAAKRAIITQIDGHYYAILVDSLEDVAPFPRQPLLSGVALEGGWRALGVGMIERDDEPVLIVDLSALVGRQSIAA